jgi:hypothetical protein
MAKKQAVIFQWQKYSPEGGKKKKNYLKNEGYGKGSQRKNDSGAQVKPCLITLLLAFDYMNQK